LNLQKWQDSLLKMWKETIQAVDKTAWLKDLCLALNEQFKLYKGDHELTKVIFRYLGALLAKLDAKNLIDTTIDLMLATVDHKDDTERQGCAQGLGLAASAHLDVVLQKITAKISAEEPKEKKGFFGGFGGGAKGPGPGQLSTIMLCYGYVAAYANPELILSRLDVHILHNLIPTMKAATAETLKINIIRAVELIAKAVHPTRLPSTKQKYILAQRDDLLNGVAKYLNADKDYKPSNDVRLLGIKSVTTLLDLSPPIDAKMRENLFNAILPYYSLTDEEAAEMKKKKKEKTGDKKDDTKQKEKEDKEKKEKEQKEKKEKEEKEQKEKEERKKRRRRKNKEPKRKEEKEEK